MKNHKKNLFHQNHKDLFQKTIGILHDRNNAHPGLFKKKEIEALDTICANYTQVVSTDDYYNASVLLRSKLFSIDTSLLKEQTEDQVLWTIAHEINHAILHENRYKSFNLHTLINAYIPVLTVTAAVNITSLYPTNATEMIGLISAGAGLYAAHTNVCRMIEFSCDDFATRAIPNVKVKNLLTHKRDQDHTNDKNSLNLFNRISSIFDEHPLEQERIKRIKDKKKWVNTHYPM